MGGNRFCLFLSSSREKNPKKEEDGEVGEGVGGGGGELSSESERKTGEGGGGNKSTRCRYLSQISRCFCRCLALGTLYRLLLPHPMDY